MARKPGADLQHDSTRDRDRVAQFMALARMRLWIIVAAFFLGYFAVSLRLVDLTLLRHKDAAEAAADRDGSPILRGEILDRNGELLATSLKMASVYADATLIGEPEKTADELADILPGENKAAMLDKLKSGRRFIWIARNITPKQEYAINALGHPGLSFEHQYRRIYPYGNLTAHILGFTDVDGHGIAGIEKSFDRELSSGEDNVTLTLDVRIQHILHRELEKAKEEFQAKAAIGMVMDVNTGDIIASVSLPDFDPHHPGDATPDQLFNRDTLGVFEMGSTFKLFPMAAAIDSGKASFRTGVDTSKPIKIDRFTISDYHAENRVQTLPEIFMHSSNIGTARIALSLGTDGLKDFYERMGFFDLVPIELPERGRPLYPRPWREVSTLTASFGHGIAVSPLHLMRAASALVNGGIMIKPQIIRHPENDARAPLGERVIRTETSDRIRDLLELTVAEGTGSKAYVEGYGVGGKTGTAEKIGAHGYDHKSLFSSFIGVYPITQPRYAVLAILDEPKPTKETYGYATGGWTGAPVVGRVIEQMGPLYQIAPNYDTSHDIKKIMAPYVRGTKLAGKGDDDAVAGDH